MPTPGYPRSIRGVEKEATVLIVDDHPSFRAFARKLLEASGLRVVEAKDGDAAIENAARLHPDLVLLDIQLPEIDGFELARRLASNGRSSPVVFISSREAADYGGRVEAYGAAGFISKAELSASALARFLEVSR